MSALETLHLGAGGQMITRLGLGCWQLGGHGWGNMHEEDAVGAVKRALERGVTFFDTADAYGLGKSETLLAEALGSARKDVVIASKGGVRWSGPGKVWADVSPAYLRLAVENSLRRLKIERIPLYYIHKPDGVTPVGESAAALERLRQEGKIGAIGVANFSVDQVRQALQAAPVAAVQARLNILDRAACAGLLELCRERAMAFVAWGALADGLLTGKFTAQTVFSADDHRSRMAEFQGGAFRECLRRVESLKAQAAARGRRLSALALRWVLDSAPAACALFGAKTAAQVDDNLEASGWTLAREHLAAIDAVAGVPA